MDKLKGIVLYDIQLDGNLNGVYINDHPLTNGEILTETARFIQGDGGFRGNGTMEFQCVWFDQVEGPISASLTFDITNGVIQAQWVIDGETNPTFSGYGFQMNERQIAISYWDV